MLKSHLPMQHTASAKLKLSKSHLSQVPQKTKCTLIQHKQKETDTWVVLLKLHFWGLFTPVRIGKGAWQQPPRLWKMQGCNTGSLSHTELWLTFQKSAPAPCALTPECRRPHYKKNNSFQKYVTSLHAQWASLNKHTVCQSGEWGGGSHSQQR